MQRIDKHRKSKILRRSAYVIIIGLLFIVLAYSINPFKNDTTVAIDIDGQRTLDQAYLNDSDTVFNMEEERFQILLHEMTHQKIKARSKRHVIEMNNENIEAMLNILIQSKYKRSELYFEILNKWKNKDFDNAVNDHNKIWKLLNEPDGKALDVMSEQEELKFKEDNFENTD